VFICGYPRSGHTWLQYLISAVVYGVNAEHANDALVNFLVTDVHVHDYFFPFGPVCFFKSHFLPQPHYRRIVYILRDGRDAMVSYYHYLRATEKENVDLLDRLRRKDLFPSLWHEHVEAYSANPYNAEILTIRYEDLHADAAAQMRRLADFAGLNLANDWIAAKSATTDFDKMRRREAVHGWQNPAWKPENQFIRRGKIGSYMDEMPADVLALFLSQAGQTLKQSGYL